MKHRILVKKRTGFSLIELIASLVLLGFMGLIAGLGLVQVTEGYIFARDNAEVAEKGQMALTRIIKEFKAIKSVSSGGATSVTYLRGLGGSTHTLSWNGSSDGELTLNTGTAGTLTDRVNSFNLTYRDKDENIVAADSAAWKS